MKLASQSIVLVGMMGAGKSSVGHRLAQRTRFDFYDTDQMIVSGFGLSVSQIFARHGESKFREAETAALRNLAAVQRAIIATGGGAVSRKENLALLKRLGVVVWLDGDEQTLFKRAWQSGARPLLQSKHPRETFRRILRTRRPLYAGIADLRIETSLFTDEEVAVAILTKLRKLGKPRGKIVGSAQTA